MVALTQDDVEQIRILYKAGQLMRQLAKQYQVPVKVISSVIKGTYKIPDLRTESFPKPGDAG